MGFYLDDVEKLITDHMATQPYDAVCAECGKDVEIGVRVDGDFDLRIVVPICKCQEAIDE